MHDSGAPRAAELTAAEQHAAWVMVRFAAEVGYRGLCWSIPNDASWRQPFLAAVPVHYDGLLADTYELRSQRRFGSSARTVCALVRREGGFEARGVPGEEWLRPLPSVVEPRPTQNATAESHAEPWLPLGPADGDQVAPRRDRRGRRVVSTVRPRRRAAATALGLLVPATALGGGLVVANTAEQGPLPVATPASSSTAPVQPAPVQPAPVRPPEVPLPTGGTQWAMEARVVLASVHEQLDVLTEAEQAWNAMPEQRRAGELPASVRDLVDSKAGLEQQRAVLEADLAAWQALRQATESLEDTEEQLANVSRAMQLGGRTAAGEQLREQQDMLARQRDAQREQLKGWSARMDAAVVDPLREPSNVKPLAESVIAITEESSEPAEPAESDDSASTVVAREPEADQPQSDDDPDDDPDDPSGDTSAPQQAEPESEVAVGVANAPVAATDTAPDGTVDVVVSGSIDVNIGGVIDISVAGVGDEITDSDDRTTDPDDQTTDPDDQTTSSDDRTTSSDDRTTDPDDQTTDPDDQTTSSDDRTTDPDDQTTSSDDRTTDPDDQTTDPDDQTTSSDDRTTDPDDQTTDPDDQTTSSDDQTTDPDDQTVDIVEGGIEPTDTPADEAGTLDPDGDAEDIDIALDNIEIDMTLEDIQVQINGETVAIDVAISGMGIIVDVDEVTDDPAGSAGDEAPTLDRAPSDTDQVALGAESARG